MRSIVICDGTIQVAFIIPSITTVEVPERTIWLKRNGSTKFRDRAIKVTLFIESIATIYMFRSRINLLTLTAYSKKH